MDWIIFYPLLVFSVIFHEVAHGLVALRQGDDTALQSGRLTLNPLPHVDLMGSIIFPTLCVLMKLPAFGWAKPVPVDPSRFHNYRSGVVLVSLAGPMANIAIAVLSVVALYFVTTSGTLLNGFPFVPGILSQLVLLNLVLAVFNLFPIPPLDGGKVVSALLPPSLATKFDAMEPYGFLIIMGLMVLGVFGRILYPIVQTIYNLMLHAVGVF